MKVELFLMAKLFACKDYADAFRAGRLYANTLGHFRRLAGRSGQADPREGALWIDTDTAFVQMGDVSLTGCQMAFHSNLTDRVNVVCLYTLHSGLLVPALDELPPDLKEKVYDQEFFLPEAFGPHVVMITDLEEFVARVDTALQRCCNKGCIARSQQGFVQYGDPQPSFFDYMEGRLRPLDPVFHKRPGFRPQNEYRIAFDTGVDAEKPRTLDIGDIRDITVSRYGITEFRGAFGVTAARSD